LSATAIIQGGPKGHPHAPLWYTRNPVEPIGNNSSITVKSTVVHESMTLESILDQIIQLESGTEIVIVCHGDGEGLELRLQKGSTAGAERDVIFALAADQPGEEIGYDGTKLKTPRKSDADLAILTRLTEPQVQALRAKMTQVRAKKLKHIAFRACNMGLHKDRDTMIAFRNFFGAASISAPKEFDSYGKFGPGIVPNPETWAHQLRKKNFQVSVDSKVVCGTKDTDRPLVYDILVAGQDKEAVRAWIKKHIADDGWGANGVVYHGVKVLHPQTRTSPGIYFVRDQEFIAGLVYFSG